MLKAVEDISATKKRLRIEIPADAIEKEIRDSIEKLRRKTTLPGFRPGKAPADLIEKRFGRDIEADVLDKVIPKGYIEALKEANITPVASPVMEEKIDFKRHEPITMTLTIEIMPKIENLKYENIKIKDIPVEVSESDIESVLKRQQEEKATYEPSEGPVDINDLIVFDSSVPESGVEAKDQIIRVGDDRYSEDFTRKITGKGKGEEFAVETTFPENHPSEKLAGKTLTMNVSIKDIKKVNLPGIDDELAKDIGFESLEALKKHISEEIAKAKKGEVSKIQKAQIIKHLVESHEFAVPESLVESEAEHLASVSAERRKEAESADNRDLESLKEELRPNAVRNVKASLLIQSIGQEQGVSVTEEEIKAAILSMSQRLAISPENVMKFYISRDGSLDGLKNSLFEDKVLDLILSKAALEKGE